MTAGSFAFLGINTIGGSVVMAEIISVLLIDLGTLIAAILSKWPDLAGTFFNYPDKFTTNVVRAACCK